MSKPAVFILEPLNRPLAEGRRAVPLAASWPVLVLLLVILGGLVGLVVGLHSLIGGPWRDYQRLQDEGRSTTGNIASISTQQDVLRVRYGYLVNGNPYQGSSRVPDDLAPLMQVNGPVEVYYLPDAPDVSRMAQETAPQNPFLISGAMGAVLLGLWGLWAWRVMVIRRGQRVVGQITEVQPQRAADGQGVEVAVRVQFTSPRSGQTLGATAAEWRDDLTAPDLPSTDDAIMLWYMNDRRYRIL